MSKNVSAGSRSLTVSWPRRIFGPSGSAVPCDSFVKIIFLNYYMLSIFKFVPETSLKLFYFLAVQCTYMYSSVIPVRMVAICQLLDPKYQNDKKI
jgi:hypothetical protein